MQAAQGFRLSHTGKCRQKVFADRDKNLGFLITQGLGFDEERKPKTCCNFPARKSDSAGEEKALEGKEEKGGQAPIFVFL